MQKNSVEKVTSTRLLKTDMDKWGDANYSSGITNECQRVQVSTDSKR